MELTGKCHNYRPQIKIPRDSRTQTISMILHKLYMRPNKIIKCVLGNGFKILGRVSTDFFQEKIIILCMLKEISPSKVHSIVKLQKT